MSVAAAEWIAWRCCASKRQYATRKRAKDAAQRTARLLGEPMTAYACRFCGSFHVSHAERRRVFA